MEILCETTTQTKELAETIGKKLTGGDVLALYGDLGAGKTTFTAFLCKALGFDNRVQSPTFVIHRIYNEAPQSKDCGLFFSASPNSSHPRAKALGLLAENKTGSLIKTVHHLDLYRLTSPEEVLELGIEELLAEESSILVIEWPEIAKELLPPQTIRIYFEAIGENSRRINVQNLS
jgi:tRNA threonylcarbamoyladenosine biosynthesis protein TsaE